MIKLGVKMFDMSDLERKLTSGIDLEKFKDIVYPVINSMKDRASALIRSQRPNSTLSNIDAVLRIEGNSVVAVLTFEDKPYTLTQLQLSKSQSLKTVIRGVIIPTKEYEGVTASKFITQTKGKSFPLTTKKGNELIVLSKGSSSKRTGSPTLFAKESKGFSKASGEYNFTVAYVKPKSPVVINKVPVAKELEISTAEVEMMKQKVLELFTESFGGKRG